MKKLIMFVGVMAISFLLTDTQAQSYRKYSIKPLGTFIDYGFEDKSADNNYSGNGIEVSKLISPRVSVGLLYLNYWNLSGPQTYDMYQGNYSPASIPGYTFYSTAYISKISGLMITSKYFFEEPDEEGQRSFYIGSELGLIKANTTLSELEYINNTTTKNEYFPDKSQKSLVSKMGFKLGYCGTGDFLSSDISIGYYANSILSAEDWILPYKPKTSAIQISWLIGFNF
jgi:hypothetical protein